jgi:hypothetical protein
MGHLTIEIGILIVGSPASATTSSILEMSAKRSKIEIKNKAYRTKVLRHNNRVIITAFEYLGHSLDKDYAGMVFDIF